jgi:hypothetical protein
LTKVNELAHTVLHGIVEFHADIIAVFFEVADADGANGLLVLQHIVDIEPETIALVTG